MSYCGPHALSIILGCSTKNAERLVNAERDKHPRSSVRGSTPGELERILLRDQTLEVQEHKVERGIWKTHKRHMWHGNIETSRRQRGHDTFKRFALRTGAHRRGVWLISLSSHFVTLVDGAMYDCDHDGVSFDECKRYKRATVTHAFEIRGAR